MRESPRYCARNLGFCAVLTAILLASAGCTVRFIGGYDEQTDNAVTALQQKVDGFLIRLEGLEDSSDCTYEHHKTFYEQVKVDVSGIQVRAAAKPNNSITLKQIELLSSSLDSLEQLHKLKSRKPAGSNCLSKDEIEPLRQNMNTSFTAILKLELAKKRGAAK